MIELRDDRGQSRAVTSESLHRRDAALPGDPMTGPRVGFILVTGGVISVGAYSVTKDLPGWSGWMGGLIVAAGLLMAWGAERVCSRFTWWYGRGVLARECREVVRAGKCPVCRYGLRAIEPERDGCRVCPECGAAWRLPPVRPAGAGGTPGV